MSKTLAVLGMDGAGKKTLVGNLISREGGIDLNKPGLLEAETSQKYADIVVHFEENNIPKTFNAPSGSVVVEDTNTPDFPIWVVDIASPDNGKESGSKLAELIAGGLAPKEKLLIVFNKMDLVNWSEWVIAVTLCSFDNITLTPAQGRYIIPISALGGGNITEEAKYHPPSKGGIPWPKELEYKTLMELL
ncbi:hypothetical protein B0T24DRAFT_290276 [Lasiosphaeria ovina]|uniref:Uncharacterized protein n=1 Tax=Lasiosphaeria ovina TaxID=92902 RepID=A0AAE0KCE5_9PEZI|nr:hypothetical protein B0T24DRAFT_290276 [Lasiosphaeria ovina]